MNPPVLGVIGGSGLYKMEGLSDVEERVIDTPFGAPSDAVMIGTLAGKHVAFLSRHGRGHRMSASKVNYRANIYALKSLGVKRIVAINACGSLRQEYAPGHIVIPDQLFDKTRGRERSFFGEDVAVHVGTADPFCARLSAQLADATRGTGATTHVGGTLIAIEGPRFSTRAESNVFRTWGMDVIGMTTAPEAFLAREAEICYTTMAHVTDYDVWHQTEEPVTIDQIIRTLMQNTQIAQQSVASVVEAIVADESCDCHSALAPAILTDRQAITPEVKNKFALFFEKYL
jgi:5'-methylthioadenosine phosphorylase